MSWSRANLNLTIVSVLKTHRVSQTKLQIAQVSTTSCVNRYHLPNLYFRKRWMRLSNKRMPPSLFKENLIAAKRRKTWEYPVAPDQKASWKHHKWYDEYTKRWVKTHPHLKGFNINFKDKRQHLFKAESIRELQPIFLDQYTKKKYVILPFNHRFLQTNMSYLYQYVTQTKYVHGLPYQIENAEVDELQLQRLRGIVEDAINLSKQQIMDKPENTRTHNEKIFTTIMQHITSSQAKDNECLKTSVMEQTPNNAMFWFRGRGFHKWTLSDDLPISYQCYDTPFLQVRTAKQLPAFSNWMGDFSQTGKIPDFYTTPHIFRVQREQNRNIVSPGYRMFVGDQHVNYQTALNHRRLHRLVPPLYNSVPYGHTQLQLLPADYSREWYQDNMEHGDITGEIEEHLKAHGIMSGWTWTAAQATCNMFWMDNDVTRPFCSQVVVTDGQWISFFWYQLNTLAVDPDNSDVNNRRNLCYGKTSVKLYDNNKHDGVVTVSPEALELLMKVMSVGADQHRHLAADLYGTEKHDARLICQEQHPDIPELELQVPLHKALVKEREEAERLAEIEAAKAALNIPIQQRVTRLLGMGK